MYTKFVKQGKNVLLIKPWSYIMTKEQNCQGNISESLRQKKSCSVKIKSQNNGESTFWYDFVTSNRRVDQPCCIEVSAILQLSIRRKKNQDKCILHHDNTVWETMFWDKNHYIYHLSSPYSISCDFSFSRDHNFFACCQTELAWRYVVFKTLAPVLQSASH
jgi:hypothetical protein